MEILRGVAWGNDFGDEVHLHRGEHLVSGIENLLRRHDEVRHREIAPGDARSDGRTGGGRAHGARQLLVELLRRLARDADVLSNRRCGEVDASAENLHL
ncbi:hypothetical protein GCM10023224_03640 [Streptomonospora halophila]|uniref:Uncharacterized protein n=1 Tax=Streptomonospora halophila TaxID=427369 RepID=A0ABP9G7I0_9ACTN